MSKVVLGGPMFEPAESETFEAQKCLECRSRKTGAHYNLYHITAGMRSLKEIFPEGEADALNLCLFSTSGIHGTYITIEEIKASLEKYGNSPSFGEDDEAWPDDYVGNELTVLIFHPRIVCMRYGNVKVQREDIPFLEKLRETSWRAFQSIGREENSHD